jgi:hypothetical protein
MTLAPCSHDRHAHPDKRAGRIARQRPGLKSIHSRTKSIGGHCTLTRQNDRAVAMLSLDGG